MFRWFLSLVVLLPLAAQTPAIIMEAGSFRVTGWQPADPPAGGWSSVFTLYAGEGDVPPMIGSYAVSGASLIFTPRFPADPGMHIRGVFRPPNGTPIEAVFEIPRAAPLAPTTRVAHVYPSASVLPENQLKFYLYFTAPMGKGRAWEKVHLVDAAGKTVNRPFLELEEELWDRTYTRLTVLFDPGRIKRGLVPLQEEGPAIVAGGRYTLVIDRDWPDGHGVPLAEPYRKEFRVSAADRTPPTPSTWRVTSPRAGTSDAVVLDFPEPMDFALLQHLLEVRGTAGNIEGSVAVERGETQWRFTPSQPWKAGDYNILVQTTLEDLAGNHVNRPFDVDVFDPITRQVTRETVSVPFRIRRQ